MMTGEEYRKSVNDGRETYFRGRRIHNVAEDPDLGRMADHVAAAYDGWYQPGVEARNPLMMPPSSPEEMRERMPLWSRLDVLTKVTVGSLSTLMTVAARTREQDNDTADRITAYVEDARLRDIRIPQCITDAKGDRSLRPALQSDPDAYVRVVDRAPDGVVIRGAKLHISGASFGHDLMVIPTKRMKPDEGQFSIACMVPVSSPGVQVVNVGFSPTADEREQPGSWRHLVFDGFVMFNDVFVPTPRVLSDDRPEFSATFAHSLGIWERLGGMVHQVDQAERLVGLALLVAEANGIQKISHIREKIDELAIFATILRAGLEAAVSNAHESPDGYYYPDELFTNAAKYYGAASYSLMVRHLHDIAGGSISTVPGVADFDNPDTGEGLRKYMSTSPTVSGEYRARLFLAIRDFTASDFGGWNQVGVLQGGGGLFAQRVVTRGKFDFDAAREMALDEAGLKEFL